MSRQANPAAIGGFVVGAVGLIIAGVLIFGSGKFFSDAVPCVMYFESDVQGLRIGAPVNFRGVQIGAVTAVKARYDRTSFDIHIPVYVELHPDGVEVEGESESARTPVTILRAMIDRGLRAQLQVESMVTGQLFIQLDMHPEAPPKQATEDSATQLLEVPTIPTRFQEIQQTMQKAIDKIAKMPLEEIVVNLEGALSNINRIVGSPEILETTRSLNATLTSVQRLLHRLDQQVEPLTSQIAKTTEHVGKLAEDADAQMQSLTTVFKDTALTFKDTAAAARGALDQTKETLASVQDFTTQSSPLHYEMVRTLRELSDSARSLRVLTDYLEQHPNSIVFGKREEKTQ
jgi:paraquat-inducible protein B